MTNMMYDELANFIPFSSLSCPKDRFELRKILYKGAQSEVYYGIDKNQGNLPVAIKVWENIGEYIDAVEEEYRTLQELSDHPNFPQFYGCFLLREGPIRKHQVWFAMEYVAGGSIGELARRMQSKRIALPENAIAYILNETVKAVTHLHQLHIMNRDVKGDNILISEDGKIKLVDFGFCRHLNSTMDKRSTSIGTPHWMAPEVIISGQEAGGSYTSNCDVWAIGITAIEIADGYPPLHEIHPIRAMIQITQNPPPTCIRISDWSQNYVDFISECLIKNPEHRPFISELLEHPFISTVPPDTASIRDDLVQSLKRNNLICNFSLVDKESTQVMAYAGQLKYEMGAAPIKIVPDDVATLDSYSNQSVLDVLQSRWKVNKYYTWLADILISINPFKNLPIYQDKVKENYSGKTRSDNNPHIFAVADKAHQDMMHHKEHQTIVLTGESGSGKTYNFHKLIDHLCHIGKSNVILMEKIKLCPVILDAFGNATTNLNLNATRHCRFFDLTFTTTGKISGVIVWIMMLEKFRVTKRPSNEGNFHIFYYMYAWLSQISLLENYELSSDEKYHFLGEPQCKTELMDSNNFQDVQNAFKVIGFSEEEIDTIMRTLAAILNLGNIQFAGIEKATIESTKEIARVSRLLSVDESKMAWSLCNVCKIGTDKRLKASPKSRVEAEAGRDALAQALYLRLMDFIVNTINQKFTVARLVFGEMHAIGILDMFGFEANEINLLPNLMVNIANEQLQYFYNQYIFEWEMQDYSNESTLKKTFDYQDNRHVLEIFLGSGCGILPLLERESKEEDGSDSYFIGKLSKLTSTLVKKISTTTFSISHFVGKLKYDVSGFVDLNRDHITTELIQTMRFSENQILRKWFSLQLTKTGNLVADPASIAKDLKNVTYQKSAGKKPRRFNTKSKGKLSQTRHLQTPTLTFRYSLIELLHKLTSSSPHFIRCILPNTECSSSLFDREMVKHQLKYHSICETIQIRQQGFSYRVDCDEFLRRYQFLAFDFNETVELTKENARLFLLRLKMEGWVIGESKVFLKYYNEEYLSRFYETSIRKIVKIQSMMRSFMIAKRMKRGILKPESFSRGDRRFANKDRAATVIQASFRGYRVRKDKDSRYTARRNLCSGQESYDLDSLGERDVRDERGEALALIYFRKWRMKTIFQTLQMYRADKKQQLVYFSQQVHLYSQELQAKMKRQNMLLDMSNVHQEAYGAHRSLLSRPKSQMRKLSFDPTMNSFFDTSYLCDPSKSKKGRHDDDDWEAPFKSKVTLPAPFDYAPDVPREEIYSNRPMTMVSPDPGASTGFAPKIPPKITRKPLPEVPRKLTPNSLSTSSSTEKGAPSSTMHPRHTTNLPKSPVVLNTWENRMHGGTRSPTSFLPSPDSVMKSRSTLDELRRKSQEPDDRGAPFNFQGLLRKTNYSRGSMKRAAPAPPSQQTDEDYSSLPPPLPESSPPYQLSREKFEEIIAETEEAML